MGKIRIKTLGLEDQEEKQKQQAEKRREAKKLKKEVRQEKVKAPQGKGGERMKQIEVSDSQFEKMKKAEEIVEEKPAEKKEKSKKTITKKQRGKKYQQVKINTKKDKSYGIAEAVSMVKKMSYAKFDETIELHLNVSKIGLKGEVSLPHGSGKQVRVTVADEKTLEKIQAGKIDFDVLISTPAMMPSLVKFAKILGPKGLMPTPKAGTVVEDTKTAVEKFSGGSARYKTEAKAPLIHQAVGKLSYKDKDLIENIEIFVKAVGKNNIVSAFISSTMSPSVRLDLGK